VLVVLGMLCLRFLLVETELQERTPCGLMFFCAFLSLHSAMQLYKKQVSRSTERRSLYR